MSLKKQLAGQRGGNGRKGLGHGFRPWVLWAGKKKKHSLKAENFVLFGRLAEEVSLGSSLSDSSEGLL